MRNARRAVIRAFILVAVCASASLVWGAGGGILNDPTTYLTTAQPGQPPSRFQAWVRMPSIQFKLNTVAGKYRIIPIVIENQGAEAVALSGATDRVVVTVGGRKVPAILELFKADRPLWDSWDLSLRRPLTYPAQVRPDESVMIYAFVRVADVPEAPESLDFTIRSLGRTLALRKLPAMAA